MQFKTPVVKILLKHKNNKVLVFFVKKVDFEEMKLCNLERIAFHRNLRKSWRKHPLKIIAWSVNLFRVCRSLTPIIQKIRAPDSKLLSSIYLEFQSLWKWYLKVVLFKAILCLQGACQFDVKRYKDHELNMRFSDEETFSCDGHIAFSQHC